MPLALDQFQYQLPPELIAQFPTTPREKSRLLVINRQTGQISDWQFDQVASWFSPGDLIVRNRSKVIPARLIGHKPTGGRMEVLLHQQLSADKNHQLWSCLIKPGAKKTVKISFARDFSAELSLAFAEGSHQFEINFPYPSAKFWRLLNKYGQTPLPPYIHSPESDLSQHAQTYQTHFARDPGSVAAPTAGLHFSPALDKKLKKAGLNFGELVLHVGWGTFLPVKTNQVSQHKMHAEPFTLSPSVVQKIEQTKKQKKRVIAVGSTTTRVLESPPLLTPRSNSTSLYIYPPRQFSVVDSMITNFHLPGSTLLMLVSAFMSYPNASQHFISFEKSLLGRAYQHAIKKKYRFYSYGDAMLIL